jgi:hypothetical protein
MKAFDELRQTTNTNVYRRVHKQAVANKTCLCTYCGWHSGPDNFDGYWGEHPSWKLLTRARKQWGVRHDEKVLWQEEKKIK